MDLFLKFIVPLSALFIQLCFLIEFYFPTSSPSASGPSPLFVLKSFTRRFLIGLMFMLGKWDGVILPFHRCARPMRGESPRVKKTNRSNAVDRLIITNVKYESNQTGSNRHRNSVLDGNFEHHLALFVKWTNQPLVGVGPWSAYRWNPYLLSMKMSASISQ